MLCRPYIRKKYLGATQETRRRKVTREVTDVPVWYQLARELPLYRAEAHTRSCSLLLEKKYG